jgi:predicted nucleotidyltransferase
MSNTASLMDLLFGDYRQRVLAVLLLQPDANFHVRELARVTGSSAGTLTRELGKLTETGLVLRSEQGNQVRYRANRDCPLFDELAGLFRKTHGARAVLAEALAPLRERIRLALIFGSVARGSEVAASDVDLLVVGDVGFAELVQALYPAQQTLQREINPVLYSATELGERLERGDAFAARVLSDARIFVIGGPDELGKLAGDRAPASARA